jgi:hypothetical protein
VSVSVLIDSELVRVFPSCLGTQAIGGLGALLVSPFNVKWRCSAVAGSLEGSKFCPSWWFCLQGMSPVSLQDFTIEGTLSASSL